MARARLLKPGFFTNDELAELPIVGRMLFAGLWTIADRAGRLEDRPRRIKAEILPYDDADVDALLVMLAAGGFIQRYTAGGNAYIAIVNFGKHQSPHVREPESVIPSPDKPDASPVQAPDKPDASPSSRAHSPIPHSGIPIPHSGLQKPIPKAVEREVKPRAPAHAREGVFSPSNPVLTDAELRADAATVGTTPEIYGAFIPQWSDKRRSNGKPSGDWRADLRAFVRASLEIVASQSARASPNGFLSSAEKAEAARMREFGGHDA